MKLSKWKTLMGVAETIAQQSPDAETKVGAVLINKRGDIIATGFNGFIRKTNDQKLPNKRPAKYKFLVHAEENLICSAARNGHSTEDSTLVCLLTPCAHCMRLMINAGITKVVAQKAYSDFQEVLDMPDVHVHSKQNKDGFLEINYEPASE